MGEMGKASDWLREERRKVLGDWTALCLRCGGARRWFEEFEAEIPTECPACGGEMIHRCPSCSAPFSSTFAVDCEECGGPLRDAELFGVPIRKAEKR
jgi:predicted nucleic acid-binding Zn ribbon protein